MSSVVCRCLNFGLCAYATRFYKTGWVPAEILAWKDNPGLTLSTLSMSLSCLSLLPSLCCCSFCLTFQITEVTSALHLTCFSPIQLLWFSFPRVFCFVVCLFVFLTVVLGRDGSEMLEGWPWDYVGEVQVLAQPVSQDEVTFASSNFYHENPALLHYRDWLTLPLPHLEQ